MEQKYLNDCDDQFDAEQILSLLTEQKTLVVNPSRKNGLILYKKYHGEFVGPGAIVGGCFDVDVLKFVPVGNLRLVFPKTAKQRITAYGIRMQWIKLIKQITDVPNAIKRAQLIINQFEHWFPPEIVTTIPDEALALLVGVFPETITQARSKSSINQQLE